MSQTAHDSVLHDLGLRIASGQIPPGTVLTLANLEAHYGTSRTVIREAVRVLESKAMVESKRRVGVTVSPMSQWYVLDPELIRWRLSSEAKAGQLVALTELRTAVEPIAARLAAVRATEDQRAEINRHANVLQRLGSQSRGDSAEYLEADIAFHDCLLEACGNLMFTAIQGPIAEMMRGRHHAGLHPETPVHASLHHHVEAAAAIVRGDAEAAERHVRAYTESILQEVRTIG